MNREEQIAQAMDLAEMATEELHPDLQPWVEEIPDLGRALKHPLVFEVPLMLPGMTNRLYAQKRAALERAQDEGDWHTCIWLHERPYRTEALIEYAVGEDDAGHPWPLARHGQEVRDLAADVWVDSENLEQYAEEWNHMLADAEPDDLLLASAEEREEFAALPERLTVYRGDIADGGWSWSLDPKVAEFFARRFGGDAPLVKGTVAKADVLGYLTRRNEAEVLVPEGAVRDIEPA